MKIFSQDISSLTSPCVKVGRNSEEFMKNAGRLTEFIDVCVNKQKREKTKKRMEKERKISFFVIAQVVTFYN